MAKKVEQRTMPHEIYVVREGIDGVETYLMASEDIEGFEDTQLVGIYELKRTARKQVEHSLL